MVYHISVVLKPKSCKLRNYLRQNGFQIFSQNYFGEFYVNHDDIDEPDKWQGYKCIRSTQLKPSQAVIQRLDDELTHGVVLNYSINVQ